MGKPTGFLEYTRREDGRRPAAERVRDWEAEVQVESNEFQDYGLLQFFH